MTHIDTYQRADTANRVAAGTLLHTAAQQRVISLARRAKLERIQQTAMPYKMRLNALVAADNRKGKLWA